MRAFGLLLVSLLVAGCSSSDSVVPIGYVVVASDDTTLEIIIDACTNRWETVVLEDVTSVTIEITASVKSGDCGAGDFVKLSSPLANRDVFDAFDGEPIQTTRR